MKTLTITKGWYWTVGDRFWPKENYPREGIGIDKRWFQDPKLKVEVEGKEYTLDCEEAKKFINDHKSWEDIKSVRLGYIPRTLLHAKENPSSTKKETMADIQPLYPAKGQRDLFHLREEVSD